MNQNAVIAAEAVAVESRGARLLQRSAQSLHIDAVTPGEPRRGELEHYVRLAFAHKHGAAVRTFMPTLLSFRDHADSLRGVAGLRGAHEDRLYLEQYLDIPVECALTAALAETSSRHTINAPVRKEVSPIERAAIVEVGNSRARAVAPQCAW